MVGFQQSMTKSQSGLESFIINVSAQLKIHSMRGLSKNAMKPQKWDPQMDEWSD